MVAVAVSWAIDREDVLVQWTLHLFGIIAHLLPRANLRFASYTPYNDIKKRPLALF